MVLQGEPLLLQKHADQGFATFSIFRSMRGLYARLLSASFGEYQGDTGEVLAKLYHVTSVEPPHTFLTLYNHPQLSIHFNATKIFDICIICMRCLPSPRNRQSSYKCNGFQPSRTFQENKFDPKGKNILGRTDHRRGCPRDHPDRPLTLQSGIHSR